MFLPFLTSSRGLFTCAVVAGSILGISANAEAVRGRDPWAFRMSLENKTRMLVLSLRPDLWAAYNPANGTLHKVWNGGIQYRGKVYDFGQRNSTTTGATYHLLEKSFLFSATDETSIPAGWTATAVTAGSTAWTLTSAANSVMTSPAVSLSKYDNVIMAYQTPAANNRLLVDVSSDNGAIWTAQTWMSAEGAADDGNQKLVTSRGDQVKFRFRRNTTGTTATLADITLFGDYRAWSIQQNGVTSYPKVDWRGYKLIDKKEGIVIRYDLVLPGGARISVEESPEALPGAKLSRQFRLQGVPSGASVSLELDGKGYTATHSVTQGAQLRTQDGDTFLDFSTDAQATLETQWTP